jgi:hypothetical protein
VANSKQRRKKRREEEARKNKERWGENSDPEVLKALAQPIEELVEDDEKETITAEEIRNAPIVDLTEEEDEEPEKEKASVVIADPGLVQNLPYGGATTWDAYDAWLLIMEKKGRLRDLQWAFDIMIENVLDNPELPLEEKADAIASLSVGFRNRVTNMKAKELIFESVKAKLSGASKNDLPDKAFAYIEPGGKKDDTGRTVPRSLRHYPIHDKSHVRNALARASQMLKKGGSAADVARKALPKIRAAAKRMGIGKPAKKEEFESGFQVLKGNDGTWRWFGWVTNQWRDRDRKAAPRHGGEILTSESHAEFVKWVDGDPAHRMPELWLWHTPGTAREKRADWLDFADGFLVAGGPLSEKEAGQLLALEAIYELGMSHGMQVLKRDDVEALITQYRSFEFSPLPREKAANLWTSFSTIVKEVAEMGFSPEKRQALVAALGENEVAALEDNTEGMAKALMELGVDYKDAEDEVDPGLAPAPETEDVSTDEEPAEEGEEEDPKELGVTEIAKALAEELNIDGLSSFLKQLREDVDAIKVAQTKDEAEIVADNVTPEISTDISKIWDARPTASDANVLKEDEAEDEDKPDNAPSADLEAEGDNAWVAQELGMQQTPQ